MPEKRSRLWRPPAPTLPKFSRNTKPFVIKSNRRSFWIWNVLVFPIRSSSRSSPCQSYFSQFCRIGFIGADIIQGEGIESHVQSGQSGTVERIGPTPHAQPRQQWNRRNRYYCRRISYLNFLIWLFTLVQVRPHRHQSWRGVSSWRNWRIACRQPGKARHNLWENPRPKRKWKETSNCQVAMIPINY